MTLEVLIEQIEYHRNGIGGEGFHAVLFYHAEEAGKLERFLATVFEEPGCLSVICLDRIPKVGVKWIENSWRGDRFEQSLREAIKLHQTQPRQYEPPVQPPPAHPVRKRRVLGAE